MLEKNNKYHIKNLGEWATALETGLPQVTTTSKIMTWSCTPGSKSIEATWPPSWVLHPHCRWAFCHVQTLPYLPSDLLPLSYFVSWWMIPLHHLSHHPCFASPLSHLTNALWIHCPGHPCRSSALEGSGWSSSLAVWSPCLAWPGLLLSPQLILFTAATAPFPRSGLLTLLDRDLQADGVWRLGPVVRDSPPASPSLTVPPTPSTGPHSLWRSAPHHNACLPLSG